MDLEEKMLYEMYVTKKMSINDISKELRVSSEKIRMYIKKYKIPLRERKEAISYALRKKHGSANW